MEVYVKVIIYLVTTMVSLIIVFQIDFNRFMRDGKERFAVLVWVLISLALGFLVGSLFVELGDQLAKI